MSNLAEHENSSQQVYEQRHVGCWLQRSAMERKRTCEQCSDCHIFSGQRHRWTNQGQELLSHCQAKPKLMRLCFVGSFMYVCMNSFCNFVRFFFLICYLFINSLFTHYLCLLNNFFFICLSVSFFFITNTFTYDFLKRFFLSFSFVCFFVCLCTYYAFYFYSCIFFFIWSIKDLCRSVSIQPAVPVFGCKKLWLWTLFANT